MILTTRRSAVLALASAAALALAGCSSSGSPTPWMTAGDTPEERSDALMRTMLTGADLPGCAAAVATHGEVVWSDAFGLARLSSATPLTPETVLDIASNSKHITGMAVLVLANEGLVDLDEPVSTYLTGLGDWADVITVTMLLHHTSNLPDYIGLLSEGGTAVADPITQRQALATLRDIETPAAPAPWRYSNSNYILLASIVEEVSGQSLADFAEERLFAPMEATLVVDPLAKYPDIAARYREMTPDAAELAVGWDVVGDGAVTASVTELASWFDVMRTGLPDYTGVPADMIAGAVEVPNTVGGKYGAGVFITSDGSRWHSGGWEGHITYVSISPDDSLTVAVGCNNEALNNELGTIALGLEQIWYGRDEN